MSNNPTPHIDVVAEAVAVIKEAGDLSKVIPDETYTPQGEALIRALAEKLREGSIRSNDALVVEVVNTIKEETEDAETDTGLRRPPA